ICLIRNSTLAYPGWLTVANSSITIENSTVTSRAEGGYAPLTFFEKSNVNLAKAKIENYCEDANTVELTPIGWPSAGYILQPTQEVNVTNFYSLSIPALPTKRITSAMLVVHYTKEQYYNGSNYFQWSKDGLTFYNCSTPWESPYPELREYEICPKYNGSKYDLWARGLRNIDVLCSAYIRFINNDPEGDAKSNVTVSNIKIIAACENDVTFVNSTLYVFDSYIDVDFQSSDVDPVKDGDQRPTQFLYLGTAFPDELKDVYMADCKANHQVVRLLDNSTGYFYNLTVDMTETSGTVSENSDPCIVADSTSEGFIGRWVILTVLDGTNASLENVGIEVIKKDIPVEHPDEPVLNYLGKTRTNYNITDRSGRVILALHSDLIGAPPSWPNSHISLNYKLIATYLNYKSSKNTSLQSFPNILSEDNTVTDSLIFDQFYIDLYPTIEVSDAEPTEDNTIWINTTIYNAGTLDAKNVTVKLYVNTTIVNQTQLTVPANSSKFVNGTTWIAQSGFRVARVVVDEENNIVERNELNNQVSRNIYVFTKPDLRVEIIGAIGSVTVNTTFVIAVNVSNSGERPANNFILSIWLGNEWRNETLSLAGGGFYLKLLQQNFPSPGIYNIIVYADSSDIIPESNETNNEITMVIEARTLPDLEIVKISLSSDVENSMLINATVRNNGGTEASNVIVKFYLGATEIGYVEITSLLPYRESSASISYTLSAGTHIIRAIADPDKTVIESNENNNELSSTFTLKTK
ncbi:MAG: CARDB domain-containing protein, partial [Candidatus Thermoplasmatota archaeon]